MPCTDRFHVRYFGSAWRRDTSGCPGGFFMDSSMHFVAALRMLAAAAGLGGAVMASAHALQVRWLLSVVGTEGTLEISRGGWGGIRTGYTLSIKTIRPQGLLQPGQTDSTVQVLAYTFCGCQDEFAEFMGLTAELRRGPTSAECGGDAAEVTVSDSAARSSPEEAARDLALIEALLASSAAGGQPVQVVQI
ncbi:hypothetical protein Vafri_21836 [Volvox africanus]|uniref:Uncharacterized protein n=1 Tax=Volvox africanus TaxID=51714 RepID=A0A8J4BUU2_9CHLO|nr:hypothetical protein Vafri_21836 [Volvox africanus]